jgi:hypothetical protein
LENKNQTHVRALNQMMEEKKREETRAKNVIAELKEVCGHQVEISPPHPILATCKDQE